MAKWDQDIHRIQEIQQLLEERQRYFRGHLNASCYQLDPNGNPLFLHKPYSSHNSPSSVGASIGHSVAANFGSIDTCSDDPPLNVLLEEGESQQEKDGAFSDPNDGNCADHSHSESSDASSDSVDKKVMKKKIKRKSPKVLRKWVNKNIKVASVPVSASSFYRKPNEKAVQNNVRSRKSSMLRFKSVFADGECSEMCTTEPNEVNYDDLFSTLGHAKSQKKNIAPNPINLLRRRSWILKAEMTSRLNDDAKGLNLNKVITGLTKTSISQAREKLKKAERSLRATVKNEHKIPASKKVQRVQTKVAEPKINASKEISKLKTFSKPAVSRLALRQQEEALRSDLNLREAFALIKIDPDPLLKLASVESESSKLSSSHARKTVSVAVQSDPVPKSNSRKVALEDSKTTQILQRLTKLSIQHLQKQKSLILNSIQPLSVPTQKENSKIQQKLESMAFEKSKKPGESMRITKSIELSRRKSSTPSVSSGQHQQKVHSNCERRTSMQVSKGGGPKLSHSSGKTTRIRVENKEIGLEGEHLSVYALDRLSGTII